MLRGFRRLVAPFSRAFSTGNIEPQFIKDANGAAQKPETPFKELTKYELSQR